MSDDIGKLIVRLALGILILLHGIAKVKGGVGFLTPILDGAGLPSWVAYGVYLGEIVGPAMVILGLATRTGAFLIFANMCFAIFLVHRPELFMLNKQGGWQLELQGIFLFVSLGLMFMNPGRYSITRRF
jgi:putative oxidoreductase